ncbi:uncharacterized protein LOC131217434, partial [Magnolia sinica]|uniref:uncharacterized protein LOC131217434 n=1 Tax=Magnolia sinica TaxID=86752 RepID=UPI00265B2FA0
MQFQFLTACVSSITVCQNIIVFLQIITLPSSLQCNPSRPKLLIFFFVHQKMSSKPPDITADLPPSVLDFREYDDDAWYGVRLVLEGETLTVKFLDFGDESDKRLGPSDFEDPKALDDFAERFRPTSVQLQDGECRRVIEGKTVCASHTFGDNDVRFYDAVVETASFPFLLLLLL